MLCSSAGFWAAADVEEPVSSGKEAAVPITRSVPLLITSPLIEPLRMARVPEPTVRSFVVALLPRMKVPAAISTAGAVAVIASANIKLRRD